MLWLAIALVIFTIWRPNVSVLASFLFGGLYILYLYLPTGMDHMENQELNRYVGDYDHFQEVYAVKKAQLEAAILGKPQWHGDLDAAHKSGAGRNMNQIGG